MGVSGLLPVLKSICADVHIKRYEGMRVGVDASSWLHRGAYSCARELCLNQRTDRYVDFFRNSLNMLRHHRVIPVVVFDGDKLPMKRETDAERRQRREVNLQRGLTMHAQRRYREADELFQRAVNVTPDMVRDVIELCRSLGVDFVVAPYEADAQLAYLEKCGRIAAVISEDSDFVAYGVRHIILKLTRYGDGVLLDTSRLPCMSDPNFLYFSRDMIVYMCVLAGCDFFPGIHGLGVRKAHSMVRKYRTLERLVQVIRGSAKFRHVPPDFEARFRRACLIFSHQRVFDPDSRRLVSLNDLVEDDLPPREAAAGAVAEAEAPMAKDDVLSFLGPRMDESMVRAIAEGHIEPVSKRPFQPSPPPPTTAAAAGMGTLARAAGTTARLSLRTARRVRGPPPWRPPRATITPSTASCSVARRRSDRRVVSIDSRLSVGTVSAALTDALNVLRNARQPKKPRLDKLTAFFSRQSDGAQAGERGHSPPSSQDASPALPAEEPLAGAKHARDGRPTRMTLPPPRAAHRSANARALELMDSLRSVRQRTGAERDVSRWGEEPVALATPPPSPLPMPASSERADGGGDGVVPPEILAPDSLESTDSNERRPTLSLWECLAHGKDGRISQRQDDMPAHGEPHTA